MFLATFLRLIGHELATRTSLQSVLSAKTWCSDEENMFSLLKSRLSNMSGYIDRLPFGEIEDFEEPQWQDLQDGPTIQNLSFILKQLMKSVPPNVDLQMLKEQYVDDLLRAIAYKISLEDFGIEVSQFRDGSSELSIYPEYEYYQFSENLIHFNLKGQIYAAAAAVGNTVAFEAFLPPQSTLKWQMSYLSSERRHLEFPLELATVNNKVHVIKRFLDHQVSSKVLSEYDYTKKSEHIKELVYFVASGPLKVATSHGHVDTAKFLIDFLAEHYVSSGAKEEVECTDKGGYKRGYWRTMIHNLVKGPMRHGRIEIFKHAHGRFRNIQSVHGYKENFAQGFVEACQMGHANFIRYIIHSGRMALLEEENYMRREYEEELSHPVLTAAAHGRVSVLEVFFTENLYNAHHPGLIRAALFGLDEAHVKYGGLPKPRLLYPVTCFLVDNGLPIDRSFILLTNEYAKVCLTKDDGYGPTYQSMRLSGDFSITFLLLLATLKEHYPSSWLRKQLWVPVRKMLKLIVEFGLDLRYGYAQTAQKLLKWISAR